MYVPPEDHQALELALVRLIDNAPLRHYYAERARARAERYSPMAMARGYRDAYAALAAGRVARAPVDAQPIESIGADR